MLTGMTDMSTDTAIVAQAERVPVGSLMTHREDEEDREFGLLSGGDPLKINFGSKISLGFGPPPEQEDVNMDADELKESHTPADRSGFRESIGMRMGDQDVDMDMKSALDRLMEDVAGGRVDDTLMTDDSFVSQDSEMTDMSIPEAPISRPKVLERAATDTALLHHASHEIGSRTVSGSSTATLPPPPVPPKDNIRAREELILRKRREAKGLLSDDSDGDASDGENVRSRPLALKTPQHLGVGRPRPRRSMSAGDAQEMQITQTLPQISEVQTDNLMGNIEEELNNMKQETKKVRSLLL